MRSHPDIVDGEYKEQIEAYSRHYSEIYRVNQLPAVLTSRFKAGKFAATRLTGAGGIETQVPQAEKTWVLAVQLRPMDRVVFYKDGKHVHDRSLPAGGISIYNMQERAHASLIASFDAVHFHLPEIVLSEISDEYGGARIDTLHCLAGTLDPVVSNIARALLPVLENPALTSPLFIDHVALGLHAHLAATYGQAKMPIDLGNLVLSDAQTSRAQEMMAAYGEAEIALEAMARECGLSPRAFVDAFKRKTGLLPHQWQRAARLDRARDLLVTTDWSIAQIALAVGFADQSHFSRYFSARFGASPRAWRVANR